MVTVPLSLLLAIGAAIGVGFGGMATAIGVLWRAYQRIQQNWQRDDKENARMFRRARRLLEGKDSEPPDPWEEDSAVIDSRELQACKVTDRAWLAAKLDPHRRLKDWDPYESTPPRKRQKSRPDR